jgi:hypothetical protein
MRRTDTRVAPIHLIMGPWEHTSGYDDAAGHLAGEVDFGISALLRGSLALDHYTMSRDWFDRFVEPATPSKLVEKKSEVVVVKDVTVAPRVDADTQPRVRYFRMGGGDGHKTSKKMMYHGGQWLTSEKMWPPANTHSYCVFLSFRTLHFDERVAQGEVKNPFTTSSGAEEAGGKRQKTAGGGAVSSSALGKPLGQVGEHPTEPSTPIKPSPPVYVAAPPQAIYSDKPEFTTYQFDPRKPVPTVGGNVFKHPGVMLSGAWDQVDRQDLHLCETPELPLSTRPDIVVFRSRTHPRTHSLTHAAPSPSPTQIPALEGGGRRDRHRQGGALDLVLRRGHRLHGQAGGRVPA